MMERQFAHDIGNFIFVSDEPCAVDTIFIPGGPDPELAEYAAELYAAGYAPLLIPSGRYGMKLGRFSGVRSKSEIYHLPYETECEFLTDVLMRCGVPSHAILGEDQAMHTKDNAFLTKKLTDRQGIHIRKAIVVCKSFHARRCQMLYQLAYPEAQILICPVDCCGISKESWHTFEYGIERVLGELARCGNQFADEIGTYLLKKEID